MDQNFPTIYYTVGIKLGDDSVGQAFEFLIESFKEKNWNYELQLNDNTQIQSLIFKALNIIDNIWILLNLKAPIPNTFHIISFP